MTETEAFIALNLLPGIGPVRVRRMMEVFGSGTAILQAGAAKLRQVEGIGSEIAQSIAGWEKIIDLGAEIARVEKAGVIVVAQSDEAYPDQLREIHDPPLVLYVWGNPAVLKTSQIAVVGTRKPSHYGSECAKKLSYQLAYAGLTITSGLARGVDTAAHHAALAARGKTIAVLGAGLGGIYPPENKELAEKIASFGGAVISEFSMATKPDPRQFPMRNRIISGLSFGLLVVEASQKSGALISANQAGEQGRTLYAVPGHIDQPGALGSNRLIQQGAKLILSAQDILDDLGLLFSTQPELIKPAQRVELAEREQLIYDSLGDDTISIDDLIAKCGLPSHEVSSTLLALEMRRLVKQLPGSRFIKLH